MAVVERKAGRTRRQAATGLGTRLSVIRKALTAWLSRPLASFHLILALCGLLSALGTVMVLSASSVTSAETSDGVYAVFRKHLLFVVLGSVVFWAALRVPLRVIRKLSPTLLFISVGLLMIVLTSAGTKQYGSQGWIVVGGISLQPVEVAKVALALWGAHILVLKLGLLDQWKHLLVPLVPVALVMFALVMAQPDLGGTVSLGVVLVALLWFAGAPKRLFAGIFLGAVAGILLLAVMAQYRLARVLSFLSPGSDTSAGGYQANQALYALADGGLFGKGLGQGSSKWHYLPNVEHDFIFALIGEELGFVGCAVVIGLFAGLAVVGLRIAHRNLDPWIRMVSGTLTVWLVSQAAINIGYVVGLLPVTGITLPLISYGGTSLVITLGLFGLLANCARHEPEAVAALRSQGPGRFGRLLRLPAPDPYRPPAKRRGSVRAGASRAGRSSTGRAPVAARPRARAGGARGTAARQAQARGRR